MTFRLALPLASLLLSGCLPSAFDGTWLYNLDLNGSYEGDCAPDADADTWTYSGDNFDWVDMYTTAGGGIVVLWDDTLKGEVSGKSFEVEAEWMYADEDSLLTSGTTMEADLVAGVLEGEVTEWEVNDYGDGDTYQCAATYDFTAERNVSSPTQYLEN